MSHDKMCTKRIARPMLSRITMQIIMVFGPLKRKGTVKSVNEYVSYVACTITEGGGKD